MLYPLLSLSSLPENLFSSAHIYILVFTVSISLLLIIVVLMDRGKKWTYLPPTVGPEVPETDTDKINRFKGDVKKEPNKYEITPILLNQFVVNHSRRTEVTHNEFPADMSGCHMNSAQVQKFASIVNSMPWTCYIHVRYTAEAGLVCFKSNNLPVHAHPGIIHYIAGYEKSGGTWPRFNHLEADMWAIEEQEQNRRNNS